VSGIYDVTSVVSQDYCGSSLGVKTIAICEIQVQNNLITKQDCGQDSSFEDKDGDSSLSTGDTLLGGLCTVKTASFEEPSVNSEGQFAYTNVISLSCGSEDGTMTSHTDGQFQSDSTLVYTRTVTVNEGGMECKITHSASGIKH
jgi:hypothetical protein